MVYKMNIEEYASKGMQYYHAEEIPDLLRKALNKKAKVILECGCGDGNLLYAMKTQGLLKSRKVLAIDLSKTRLKLAQTIDDEFDLRVDNAETLSKINSGSIDLVISSMVIEHVNDKKMLKAIHRVLRKGGLAYISTVFKKWYGWYYYKGVNGKWLLDPTHLREYTSDRQLTDLVDKSGLKVIDSEKKPFFWPIIHPVLKLLNVRNRLIFDNKLIKFMEILKIPIPGYYSWGLILKKS